MSQLSTPLPGPGGTFRMLQLRQRAAKNLMTSRGLSRSIQRPDLLLLEVKADGFTISTISEDPPATMCDAIQSQVAAG
jgi:hypothetical protein